MENYFTHRLPAELRLLIYKILLRFNRPLKISQYHLWKQLQGIALFRVCHLIYEEALPVFYELNTIMSTRDEFCRFCPVRQPAFNPELIQELYVRGLDPSINCVVRPWLSESEGYDEFEDTTCVNCEDSLFSFIKTLKSLPRIRKVCIDYYRHNRCVEALWKKLSGAGPSRSHLYLNCVGVGKYRLEGPGTSNIDLELRDSFLSSWWDIVTQNVRDSGRMDSYRIRRQSFHALRLYGYSFLDTLDYVNDLAALLANHKVGRTPANLTRIWPGNLPFDFHFVARSGRSEVLHKFNVELQNEMDRYCRRQILQRRIEWRC